MGNLLCRAPVGNPRQQSPVEGQSNRLETQEAMGLWSEKP